MKLLKNVKFIYNHPFNAGNKIGGLAGFLKWQINCRLNPFPIVYPYTENSKLLIYKGLSGATGNLYCGLMDYEDMGFLLHFLRPNDMFVDIGANVGAYTILASAENKAHTVAIEPIFSTFQVLTNNILINQIQNRVKALNIGLGSEKGSIKFTKAMDSMNHVASDNEKDTIPVDVDTLDLILNAQQAPSLIKIDVEGFENEVLKGAEKTIENNNLKAIIIELNGLSSRYGFDDNEVHLKLLSKGFLPYRYNPRTRELKELTSYGNQNTIYIRDKECVSNRVIKSRLIKVGRNNIEI